MYITSGLRPEEFDDLMNHIPDVKNTQLRSRRTAMGIFWMKLRTRMSFDKIGDMCNLGKYAGDVAKNAFYTVCDQLDR